MAWKEKLRVLQGRNDPDSQWVQVTNPQTVKRNRYANIQPWDRSRIHLKVAQGKSDYINASPISLRDPRTGRETNYIATQVINSVPVVCGLMLNSIGTKTIEYEPFLAHDMAGN